MKKKQLSQIFLEHRLSTLTSGTGWVRVTVLFEVIEFRNDTFRETYVWPPRNARALDVLVGNHP